MRFDKIENFNVDDLHLDEGNYRFKKASDQKDCIEKIYSANPQYFKGLMKSIAEDDLGELLLVYRNKKENIVLDGNRRLAAIKVLDSDKCAPVENLKTFAQALRTANKTKMDFSNIQAQVSDDKKLVLNTVYERHAAAKSGKARINWSAYAAARFRYDQKSDDTDEWHITALLLKAEEKRPSITDFLDSGDYSHEVFRRLMKAAFNKKIISTNIFSEKDQRIKNTAQKKLLDDAVSKAYKFLLAMKDKKLSLSRKDKKNYADKNRVTEFLSDYKLSPDNQRLDDAKSSSGHGVSEGKTQTTSGKGGNVIDESSAILQKLNKLKSKKLSGLYNSLCTISLIQHPALMYVGAWCFFEVLSKCMGNAGKEFTGYFGSQTIQLGLDKATGKDCGNALKDIQKYGNATKHSQKATPMTAIQLKNDFEVLEPLIVAALDKSIAQPKKST